MTSLEFTESMAFEELEPDPAEWSMQLLADMVSMMANERRGKGEPAYHPLDFLPGGDRQKRLARSTAVMATFAAISAERKRPN